MLTRVAAFPIGMDPSSFAEALKRPDVKSNIAQLLQRYAGRKVLFLSSLLKMHPWQCQIKLECYCLAHVTPRYCTRHHLSAVAASRHGRYSSSTTLCAVRE